MNAATRFSLVLGSNTVTFALVDPSDFSKGVSVNGAARIPSADAEQHAVKLIRGGWRVAKG